MPEATHTIMWVLSPRGVPRSYRMMEGFGVHSFKWINAEGKASFVKYHWKPKLGTHSVMWDEAQKISGLDPDFHRRDLWEAIDSGNYPEWELGVQIVAEEDEHKFDFDLLDPTKIIPEALVPVKIIGKMTLNRNPDNFFAETEQVAFHPGHVVPGIDFTNDPLLQGRLFSYIDTQLKRLGGPNFHEIPINRPIAPMHNNQRDGHMRQEINKGRVSYEPNSLGGGCPFQAKISEGGFTSHTEKIDARKIRARSKSFNDYFSQATLFYHSQTPPEKQHIIDAFHFELGKVETVEIRKRMVGLLTQVDKDLAKQVADALGFEVPEDAERPVQRGVPADHDPYDYEPVDIQQAVNSDETLSMEFTVKDTILTRKIAFLCCNGVDSNSIDNMKEALTAKGAKVKIVAPHLGTIKDSNGKEIKIDESFSTTGSVLFDALFIPSGEESINTLKTKGKAIHFLNETYKHCKPIALDDKAKELLDFAYFGDILAENDPQDEGVFISELNTSELSESFIQAISQHRFWERAGTDKIPS